jgi:hypothetical protein
MFPEMIPQPFAAKKHSKGENDPRKSLSEAAMSLVMVDMPHRSRSYATNPPHG